MKKTAIALVMLICLLTGALLPALAEMDAPRPAVTDAPGAEEKPTEEAELPEKDEVPAEPKATEAPREENKREAPAEPDEAPAEPKATEAPRGGDGRRNFAVPKAGEKPDAPAEEPGAFESLEPLQPHGHPGAAHGKRHHGEDGPKAGPDAGRRPGAGRGPHHEAPHCRRCDPERSRPHCHGCPFAHKCPGRQDSRPVGPQPDEQLERETRREAAEKKMSLPLGPGTII